MQLDSGDIRRFTSGEVVVAPADGAPAASSFTWDSREVVPGCLFAALAGARTDGHDHVDAALEGGAAAVLIEHDVPAACLEHACKRGAAVIKVADTRQAITDLARGWRGELRGTVIGLTGSTGKTTTKNIVRDVLSAKMPTVATLANQNNELGVPRTVLSAEKDTCALVVEMGMRGRGQIAQLADIARPDWGIITTVGESHIELLGSRDNIARAKMELFEALPDGAGKAFFSAQDDYARFLREQARLDARGIEAVTYAVEPESTEGLFAWAENVSLDGRGRASFVLALREGEGIARRACSLELCGVHNVSNALAAAAVAAKCGMSADEIACALAQCVAEKGRWQVVAGRGGCTLIDDSYNANPQSMAASLRTLERMETAGRRIAVLGDMAELGDCAQEAHERIGRLIASLRIDRLVCVGAWGRVIGESAQAAGCGADVVFCADGESAWDEAAGAIGAGDLVLVKASHCMELDRFAERLAV